MLLSACVATLTSRSVLHHCVVIFFWSSRIMEYICMLFTFENGVALMRWRGSVVWHHSLLLMNSFNKTEAAVFSCRPMLPFHQFNNSYYENQLNLSALFLLRSNHLVTRINLYNKKEQCAGFYCKK